MSFCTKNEVYGKASFITFIFITILTISYLFMIGTVDFRSHFSPFLQSHPSNWVPPCRTLSPLRVYMYDIPRRFNVGMLRREDSDESPVTEENLPPWPRSSGLRKQHSVEYWMMASLLYNSNHSDSKKGDELGMMEAIRVFDPEIADVFFVPFFSSLSFNVYGHNMTDPVTERDKQLQVDILKFLRESKYWQRSGGRDHVIPMHHPNAFRFLREQVNASILIVADFGRYSKSMSNLRKDVVAPYVHVVDSFTDDDAPDPFKARTTLLFFRGRTVRKDEGVVRARLAKILVNYEDVHYERSVASEESIKLVQVAHVVMPATSGAASMKTIFSSLRRSFILRTFLSLVTSYLSHQPNQTHHHHYHNHQETHHHYHQCTTPSQNTNHNNQHTHLAPPTSPQPPSTPSPQPPSPPSPSCPAPPQPPQPPQPPAHPLAPPTQVHFFRVVFWWWPSAYLPSPYSPGEHVFRLHGIWPAGNDGKSITKCTSTEKYVKKFPKSIPGIETCWTAAASTNSYLWKNEWVKHGTCTGLTVKEYFMMGMWACTRFSSILLDALVSRGLTPGLSRSRMFYLTSFEEDLMGYPEILCTSAFQRSHLYQVMVCLDLQYKVINCRAGNRFGNCEIDTPIFLRA